jgi:hypothetical protein
MRTVEILREARTRLDAPSSQPFSLRRGGRRSRLLAKSGQVERLNSSNVVAPGLGGLQYD